MMQISLNGEATDSHGAQTVHELVVCLDLPSETVLIEHNGVALHRREWQQTLLSEGDRIEIIRVVAGG
jgi:thiamine biosynthesis protein ThiS